MLAVLRRAAEVSIPVAIERRVYSQDASICAMHVLSQEILLQRPFAMNIILQSLVLSFQN